MSQNSEDFPAIRSRMLLSSLEHTPKISLPVNPHSSVFLYSQTFLCLRTLVLFLQASDRTLHTILKLLRRYTELIGRMNDSEQELCVRGIRIEVYGFFSFQLPQDSTTQDTGTCENWVTCFLESLHPL